MARRYTRQEVVERLKAEIGAQKAIIAAIVGNGMVAKMCEKGGIDLMVTYILARYRMAGHSSMLGYLPIGDNNAITLELGEREILPAVRETPVIAGLFGCDVTRDLDYLLDRAKNVGFSGVHNAPTICLIDGTFGQALAETGIRFDREVEMIRLARERDMFTQVFVSNPAEAEQMVEAGADLVIAHLGNSIGGTIGAATALSNEEAAARIQPIIDAARALNPGVMTMCHGGSVIYPQDFAAVLKVTRGLDGYMGGSSIERLPVEASILETVQRYKNVPL